MEKHQFIIKRLDDSNRDKVADHFLRLDSESIYSRFRINMSEEQIKNYCNKINFEQDGIFGIFDEKLKIVGIGECLISPKSSFAEIGFSVDKEFQGLGFGTKLMEKMITHAKSKNKSTIEMSFLNTNKASLNIAKKFGLDLDRDGGETIGHIKYDNYVPEQELLKEKIEENMSYFLIKQKESLDSLSKLQHTFSENFSNTMDVIADLVRPKMI